MDPRLLGFTLLVLGVGALSYRLGGPGSMARQRSLVGLGLVLPPLLLALALQAGAESRLRRIGITPHPALAHSIGVGVGVGHAGTWVFAARATPEDVFQYYAQPETHVGWQVVSRSPMMWTLQRGKERLQIGATSSSEGGTRIVFALQH